MTSAVYAAPSERAGRVLLRVYCAAVLLFLVVPILAVIPLSFNSGPFLNYPLAGFSLRWYREFLFSPLWIPALENSVLVALAVVALATPMGTLAAVGLVRLRRSPLKAVITGLALAPMIVPVIITAIGIYFLFAPLGLANSYLGLILAQTVLAVPFVVVVVSATLLGFDASLIRAGASLGATPVGVFLRVVLPLIAPGVLSGALFAFTVSFDELITAILLAGPAQRTLPLQMFDGVRELISPTITAVATILIVVSALLLTAVELLRRRAGRLRTEK